MISAKKPTKDAPVDAYRRPYSLRAAIPGKKSIEVTFPYEVVEREAARRELTVDQFIREYQAVAQFDNFEGVFYTFEAKRSRQEDAGVS